MAQYDASIRINTQINTQNASSQLMSLENRIVKTADKIASLRSKMDALKDAQIPTQTFKELDNSIKKAESDYAKLQEKMKNPGKATDKYKYLQNELQKVQKELDKLVARQTAMEQLGIPQSGTTWDSLNEEVATASDKVDAIKEKMASLETEGKAFEPRVNVQELENAKQKVEELKQKMVELKESGGAYILGEETEEYAKLSQELKYAQNDLAQLNQRHKELSQKQKNNKDGYKKLGKSARDGAKTASKSVKGMSDSLKLGFKNLLKYGLGIRSLYALISKIRAGIKEGFSNLYNDKSMKAFKNSVDSLKASALTLKNSFAAAFRPIVEIAIPYIQKLIGYMTQLLNVVGQFMAAITGQKKYTKAIKQTADAFNDAEKSADGYLSPLDEINKFQKKDSEEQELGTMFEEVPIDTKILDFVQKIKDLLQPAIEYAQKLKDIFSQGFFDGLGDWEYRWESIKDSVSSIKDSLSDIFTDPNVIGAADKWAQSVAYVLGSFAGSVASIGLTIATNLLGGISKYLEENKDRIKGFLISMFDIWEEVNRNFAEFFQSVAYVFEAFASENGQQLTANIIGIFADAFMGIQELASKAFRDVSNIIIQPFVDNKEGFKTALEGFLGVLSEVTGTIKQGIDETFDKLNEVYDAHFKPMFDSIAQGLSDIVGKFLEFWNETVQPILEKFAQKFDVLWKEHIQPFLNKAAELFGSIADLIKALWENILKPFIEWLIQNVLPAVMPVLENIYNAVVNVIGGIIDYFSGFIDYCKGVIDFLTGIFSGDWEKAFSGISEMVSGEMEMIQGIIETVISVVGGVINGFLTMIKSKFEIIFNAIKSIVKAGWDFIKKSTDSFVSNFKSGITNGLNAVKNTWNNVLSGIKTAVQNVFGSILRTIMGVIDTIKNAFSSVANWFGGLFGGKSTSVSVSAGTSALSTSNPSLAALNNTPIPRLATGAVIPANREFLAVLGDQKHGTNIEAPLETIKQASMEAVAEVLSKLGITGSIGNSNPQTIIIKQYLDGKQVAESIVKEGKVQQMATGNNMFLLGTT